MNVEWLLGWAYAREKVHLARERGLDGLAGFTPRGFAKASHTERVGAAVGSSMNLGFEAPSDAYAVQAAVDGVDRMLGLDGVGKLVRTYALIGGGARPDWVPVPAVRVVPGATGHKVHLSPDGKVWRPRGKAYLSVFRMVHFQGDTIAVLTEKRTRYSEWALGVAAVYRALARPGVLVAHCLAPHLPPLEPWTGG